MPMNMEEMEKEIIALHDVLESRGINSRKTQDIFGRTVSRRAHTFLFPSRDTPPESTQRAAPRERHQPPYAFTHTHTHTHTALKRSCLRSHPPIAQFELPVNSEHKAVVCSTRTICSTAQPHMRTFWAATIGFFCTFFSCFAPGALGAYYKKPVADGGLGLVKSELALAGNLAVTGTILMRVAAGPMCDTWGARKTFIMLLLIGIPGMIIFAFSQGAASFIIGRILIGLSLATFVTCQVWCSQFFDRSIVGTVNATAGGWGNVGGGVTLLTMPFIMEIFLAMTGSDIGTSWRLCMIASA